MPAKKGKPGDAYFKEIRESLDGLEKRYSKVARATTGKKHEEAKGIRDALQAISERIEYRSWLIERAYGGDE